MAATLKDTAKQAEADIGIHSSFSMVWKFQITSSVLLSPFSQQSTLPSLCFIASFLSFR